METHCKLASLIGHEALHEGELMEPTDGYDYRGTDDRGLPIFFVREDDNYSHACCDPLEGIHLYGYPVLDACPHLYPHLPNTPALQWNRKMSFLWLDISPETIYAR